MAPILIVDDTVFNVEIVRLILGNMYKLPSDKAFSGFEAISKIQQRFSRQH
jgi:CheY-like chemotaxis protein